MSTKGIVAGRVALVTGGGSGIGRACCQVLAREGAKVVVIDVNVEAAQDTLALLQDPDEHMAMFMEVSDRQSVEVAFSAAMDQCGTTPSLLVNSASKDYTCPFLEAEDDKFMEIFETNMKGTFLTSQTFARQLVESSGDDPVMGAIVNIASIAGKTGSSLRCLYSATKGGVMAFTRTCATEMASKGIRVNCVLPGNIVTPNLMEHNTTEMLDTYNMLNPLHRLGQPQEVAEVIVFLLSERSSYMVGSCIEVAGGYCM